MTKASFFSSLLNLLYPPICVSCGTHGDWWCEECRNAVERTTQHPCASCLSLEAVHSCSRSLPFAGVVATGFYHSPPLRKLIADLKYQGVTAGASSVETYLETYQSSRATPLPWSRESTLLIQPMPLEPSRERERGFNQATWVAERMNKAWQMPGTFVNLLARRKGLSAQAELEHEVVLRRANVNGQFIAIKHNDQPVLLVDDVVTTGSTAAEAARVLLATGTPRVYLAALAIGK